MAAWWSPLLGGVGKNIMSVDSLPCDLQIPTTVLHLEWPSVSDSTMCGHRNGQSVPLRQQLSLWFQEVSGKDLRQDWISPPSVLLAFCSIHLCWLYLLRNTVFPVGAGREREKGWCQRKKKEH